MSIIRSVIGERGSSLQVIVIFSVGILNDYQKTDYQIS